MAIWGIHTNGDGENGGGFRGSAVFADAHDSGGTPGFSVLSVTNATWDVDTRTIGGLAGAAVSTMVDIYVFVSHASEPNAWGHYVESITDVNSLVLDSVPAGWDIDVTSVTIKIGGFFETIEDAVTAGADVISAGDTVQWVDGMTDSLTGNATLTAGTVPAEVLYESVDSSGVSIDAERAVQGSDGQKSGQLVKTAMSDINCGTSQLIPSGNITLSSLHVRGTVNGFLLNASGVDIVHLLNCAIINTGSGVSSACLTLDNSIIISNCDMISESTSATVTIVAVDTGCIMVGCYIESKSTSASVVLCNTSTSLVVNNCVFAGTGVGTGIELSVRAGAGFDVSLTANTFYGLDLAMDVAISTGDGSPLLVTGNLAVNCDAFVENTDATESIRIIAHNNTLPPTGTMPEADRYKGDIIGVFAVNDTINSTDTASSIFEDVTTFDFRLKSPGDALLAASFGADAGAVRNLGTGGAGGGAPGHGTTSGGMQ